MFLTYSETLKQKAVSIFQKRLSIARLGCMCMRSPISEDNKTYKTLLNTFGVINTSLYNTDVLNLYIKYIKNRFGGKFQLSYGSIFLPTGT